ncbi:hypothetical protein BCR41DRAFT_425999 [Lobosporangium transversale]|uniref:Uncharacterized protein n=1 Tax=Lobosporangium transversale TaxID=64571 RepID=A0A1Y2GCU7_9FUNG|nr:hypothetical protein BCR41DRAFT_425999 [Lobosporangium transversale]ORZ04337.1 hypothetical protein BCR41DRAFT_425999 [Lobosporangium transversale]|eukprot:XP_021876495.1 hypothetical protein BCR41DRAFT_425999 [Lobosporangium transversale]
MVPHSIRKRKEPSDSPAQHDTQLSKRRRNEKKQGQREIAGSQYSRSGASRAKDIKSYTPMTPPSLTANTVNDWSSPSSWMRSSNYNNRNPNTPSSNSGIANDVSSSYSWTRSSNCNNRNPNQMHRTLMRGPATKLETIWESVWESEPYLVPQAKDDEATAISNRNGAAAIYVRSSHDTAATALLSTVVSSASVKSTGSQPDHVIQTDAVEGSTALISPKPRPHE